MHFGASMFFTDYSMSAADLARALEARGFESIWAPEHSHIPTSRLSPWGGGGDLPKKYYDVMDPFVSLTMAGAVTKTLKLATGVCLVQQRDPIQTAKLVASLDQVSGGRFLFGIGNGWNAEEMADHGTAFETRHKLARERIEAMKEIWTKSTAEYHGEMVDFGPMVAWPKPVQKPHPPMWMALAQPTSFDVAASHGLGVLCNSVGIPQRLTRRVRMYKDAVQSPTDPVSSVINNQVAAFAHTLCAEDDKPTREFIGQAYRASFRENLSLAAGAGIVPNSQYGATLEDFYIEYSKQLEDAGKPFPEFLKYSLEREQGAHLQRDTLQVMSGDQLVNDAVVIGGDPESCIRGLKMYEESGIDQFMVQPDWGFITHEQIMESYRLFGKYIIPKFKASEVAAGART